MNSSLPPVPFRGVPAAPNNALIRAEISSVEPLPENNSVRQITIHIDAIISGISPFITPGAILPATVSRDISLSNGDLVECRAEYLGDERGGKASLSEVKIIS